MLGDMFHFVYVEIFFIFIAAYRVNNKYYKGTWGQKIVI